MSDSRFYEFVTAWRVEGTCGEVADIVGDPLGFPRWWPSVFLDVQEVEPPDANGLGRRVRLHTKGWLPYTLRWESIITASNYPSGFTMEAVGDFAGRGIWTFTQDGPSVDIVYDWRIAAKKPLLRALSGVLRPVFEANHKWSMAQGQKSLELELARRRTTNDAARAHIPPPPGPVTYGAIALLGGAALVGGTLAYLMIRSTRRSKRS